jgi:hypothetical protein
MDIGRVLIDTIARITEQANLPPAREATPCPARRESLARVTTASRRANVAYECGVSPGVLLTPARPGAGATAARPRLSLIQPTFTVVI